MALIEGLILSGILFFLFYKYVTRNYDHWEKLGVKHPKPRFPFGNTFKQTFQMVSQADGVRYFHDLYPNEKVCGLFGFSRPVLIIRDPDLIKQIAIKDFDYFTDRNPLGTSEPELLLGKSLITLQGQEWREMRNKLSPAFTASKLKSLFPFFLKCCQQMTDYINSELDKQESKNHGDPKVLEQDFKLLTMRFANDVIANTAFGIEVDSLKDPENQFYLKAREMNEFGAVAALKFVMLMICPFICKILGIQFLSKSADQYLRGIVYDAIKLREEKKIVRTDLLQLMLDSRKEAKEALLKNKDDSGKVQPPLLTDYEIASQCLLFFFAGFETASTAMSFISHELAVNQDVQDKLRQEIEDVIESENGKMTYDGVINKMKYLDMVVSESLRKWPPMFFSERIVSKPYVLKAEGCPDVPLKVGDYVGFCEYALHRDAKYFPDPDKFDPERFSDENKANIAPYTYLPFGTGPRACIGMRFALMEVKTCLAHLVRNFVILPTATTQIPLKLDRKNAAALSAEKGFILGLKRVNRKD